MIELYNFKIIKSGKEIEVYHYKEKQILRGFKKRKYVEKVEEIAAEATEQKEEEITPEVWAELIEIRGCDEEKEKLKKEQLQASEKQQLKAHSSICRTRTSIRRLVNTNAHLNQFLTLTFGRSMPKLKEANKLFDRAIKRIMRAYPWFEYIAVNEFQGDTNFRTGKIKPEGGSVHYHLLCNLGPKDTSEAAVFAWERKFAVKYWQNGFVKIKPVQQVTNMGAYFCKYLSKGMFDKRMFRKKKFFCSRTLNRPTEMVGAEALSFYNKFVKSEKPVFEKTFESKWTGEVEYKAHTLPKEVE